METTSTQQCLQWWTCAGCQVDVELGEPDAGGLGGCEVPCPDCGEPTIRWREWDAAA